MEGGPAVQGPDARVGTVPGLKMRVVVEAEDFEAAATSTPRTFGPTPVR
jgi:hypothetical protein